MVIPLYKEIILHAGANNTIVMGDSAGGGFALALAQRMKYEDVLQPDKIILLSPWLDITLMNPDIKKIDPFDPFLGVPGLQKAGSASAGDSELDNFMLSPINGSMEQLGQIIVYWKQGHFSCGCKEILFAGKRKRYFHKLS
jgi:acetyl esterase/lipase